MFNYNIALVLTTAKKVNKWTPARYLVKHGLYSANINYLADKGYIVTKNMGSLGTTIKLTLEGYYEARRILDTEYSEAN